MPARLPCPPVGVPRTTLKACWCRHLTHTDPSPPPLPPLQPLPLWQKAVCGLTAGGLGALVGSPADLSLIRMQADTTLPPEQRRNYKARSPGPPALLGWAHAALLGGGGPPRVPGRARPGRRPRARRLRRAQEPSARPPPAPAHARPCAHAAPSPRSPQPPGHARSRRHAGRL